MGFSDKLKYCRENKNCRLTVIGVFIVIVLLLLFFWGKAKGAFIAILVMLLLAFGVELFDYDIDLGRLWETGSVADSRVEHKNGMKIFWEECSSNNLNCSDFSTQPEAQALYDKCAAQIAADNNASSDEVRNVDVYWLDRDKDGIVCEALPIN